MGNITDIITKLFKSKTLILGWLTFVAGLISYLSGDQFIAQHPEFTSVLITVLGVLQVIIRWLTKIPLDLK